ncbi:MAG: DUF3488 domain-containing protein [Acidobacteriota bacterium]|nr:MAG: DUF3488 domain-containing protein [Acidobacteriota bacterium]
MNFDRYFYGSSYALLAIGFVMLVSTRQVDTPAMVLFALVLIAGWMRDTGKLGLDISQRTANLLMICYLPFAIVEWQVFAVSPVLVVIHFILFASALKLLRSKRDRDWLWLYLVSFCQVLMTAGMMVGSTFLMLLMVYLFAAISAFIGFEVRRSRQSFMVSQGIAGPVDPLTATEYWTEARAMPRRRKEPRSRIFSWFSAAALILIIVAAIPIFLAMPRLTRGGSRNGLLATETLSGFSDTVTLGEVAQVKLNPQVVMRVRVKFPPGIEQRPLRWRGVTLDFYDGKSWSQSASDHQPLQKVGESFRVDERASARGFTQQRFFVEPLNINTVFAAPRPIYVMGLRELDRDSGDGLWTGAHPFSKLDYLVYSDTHIPADAELIEDNDRFYPAEVRQRYLQLPLNHDQRITRLVADVTSGATTQFEMAQRIERHLKESYSYSLDLQPVESGDPVADFLFNRRTGHCEYFASAMVLMARSRRIPARLVNGFQTGEYNESADVYTVRQSDAHSWVEVYFPSHGWVAFDPTPPDGLSQYGDGWVAWMRQYREAIEMFWLEHVIGFDTGKQITIAYGLQRWLAMQQRGASVQWFEWASNLAHGIDDWMKSEEAIDLSEPGAPVQWGGAGRLGGLLFGLTALVSAALLWRRHRGSWRNRIKRGAAHSAVIFYEEMLRTLDRAGHRRAPDQTPSEFAARLSNPAVDEITFLYLRSRFGNAALAETEIERVDRLLADLKKDVPGVFGKMAWFR